MRRGVIGALCRALIRHRGAAERRKMELIEKDMVCGGKGEWMATDVGRDCAKGRGLY